MIRSFIALPLPDEVRDVLDDLQTGLKAGRLVLPENLHITLAYLDKQTPQTLDRVHEVLEQMRVAPFHITLKGVDVFGGNKPRLVWAGVEPSPQLTDLREKVRRAAMRSGVDLARERFRPHVTLSRLNRQGKPRGLAGLETFLAKHAQFETAPFLATEIVFYRSTLHPDGATYDPMVTYSLLPP
ncbi:MAG: RNA 2',3'-cyclic phosphodiesterase [Pseudomonadota bacterium]